MKSEILNRRLTLKEKAILETFVGQAIYWPHFNMIEINKEPEHFLNRSKIRLFVNSWAEETGIDSSRLIHIEEAHFKLGFYIHKGHDSINFDNQFSTPYQMLNEMGIHLDRMLTWPEFHNLIAEFMIYSTWSYNNHDHTGCRYKTAVTIKEYKTTFNGYDLIIPAGSKVGNRTACGYDDNYHFWMDYQDQAEELTGVKNSGLRHDLRHYGVNIPAEYCNPYI